MRNITKLVAGAGLAAGTLLTMGATTAQANEPTTAPSTAVAQATDATAQPTTMRAGGSRHGCPHGAVCIYPRNKGWNHNRPSNVYWSYGVHRLHNQYGKHYVLNNQSGGAKALLCKRSNGTKCTVSLGPAWYYTGSITPFNSLKLVR